MIDAVSVVTGSRKGIGRHLVECALAAGSIVVGCSRDESDLCHERYEHIRANVADEAAMVRLFSQVRRTYGRVDHLVNCAGIASMNHVLLTPGRAFRAIYETNVFGTFYCSREAAKLMQTRRFGRIVNFSSVALPLKLEGEAAYASSKAAVVALTEVMARASGQSPMSRVSSIFFSRHNPVSSQARPSTSAACEDVDRRDSPGCE